MHSAVNRFLAVVLVFLFSTQLYAAGGRSGYVDLTNQKLQLISGSETSSRLFVYGVTMNDSTCTVPSTPVLFFDELLAKEIYSTLLTAKVAGKRVLLIASECASLGNETYPKIFSIYIE